MVGRKSPPSPTPSPLRSPPSPSPPPSANQVLIWSEEFSPCAAGTPNCNNGLNTAIWQYDNGDGSQYTTNSITQWGNGQLQCNSDASENVRVESGVAGADGGVLTINAVSKPVTCGVSRALNATGWRRHGPLRRGGDRAWVGTVRGWGPWVVTVDGDCSALLVVSRGGSPGCERLPCR